MIWRKPSKYPWLAFTNTLLFILAIVPWIILYITIACLITFSEQGVFFQNYWLKIEKICYQKETSKIPLELLLQTLYNLFKQLCHELFYEIGLLLSSMFNSFFCIKVAYFQNDFLKIEKIYDQKQTSKHVYWLGGTSLVKRPAF